MATAQRHQSDINESGKRKRGPDLTIRFHTKRQKEMVKRAARASGLSLNRYVLNVLNNAAVPERI